MLVKAALTFHHRLMFTHSKKKKLSIKWIQSNQLISTFFYTGNSNLRNFRTLCVTQTPCYCFHNTEHWINIELEMPALFLIIFFLCVLMTSVPVKHAPNTNWEETNSSADHCNNWESVPSIGGCAGWSLASRHVSFSRKPYHQWQTRPRSVWCTSACQAFVAFWEKKVD